MRFMHAILNVGSKAKPQMDFRAIFMALLLDWALSLDCICSFNCIFIEWESVLY